jgi:IS4 transposase
MAILTIDIVFDLSDEDLAAVYDQTAEIENELRKIILELPLGKYLTDMMVY